MERNYNVQCGTRTFAELIAPNGLLEEIIYAEVPLDCVPEPIDTGGGGDPPANPPPEGGPPDPDPPAPPPPVTCNLTQDDCPDGPFNEDECRCDDCPSGTKWHPGGACKAVRIQGSATIDENHTFGNAFITIEADWSHNCWGNVQISYDGGVIHSETNETGYWDVDRYSWSQRVQCQQQRKTAFMTLSVTCRGIGGDTFRSEVQLPNCQDLGIR
jgi:hypothetical protein